MESELRKAQFETQRAYDAKTLQSDAHGILQSKIDREKLENTQLRDKMARLENDLELEKNASRTEMTEKKLAF